MNYNNQVILTVAKELERRRMTAQTLQENRHAEAVAKIPEITALEHELSMTGLSVVKAIGMGKDAEQYITELSKINLLIQGKIKSLLKGAGLPENYLEVPYVCKKCSDTGFVEGRCCVCRETLLRQSALNELGALSPANTCSFDSFNLSYYPAAKDERYGLSPREQLGEIYEYCKSYAEDFSLTSKSLFMHGATGLGKTHLSLAIARAVTEKGYNVIYGSCPNLLKRLEREHFGGRFNNADDGAEEELLNCDLLIIDDLGAEFATSFTTAEIYNIINTRINCSLPVIINTNLTVNELEEKYTQRITSRIIGCYVSMLFIGKDVRQLKNN